MTEEQRKAASIQSAVRKAIDSMMSESERSQWAKDNKIGVSDIGGCREFVRRTILDEPYSDERTDYAAAFMGTAAGDLAERAMKRLYGDGVDIQLSITVHLDIAGYRLLLPGHPDVVTKDTCVDFKSKDKLGVVRRAGAENQQKYQVSLYTKALIEMGRLPKDAWCALAFLDRSGTEADPHVEAWRYDPALVLEAEQWLEDVIYAVQHDEEASKDMPRTWCWECCPRVTACRGMDTDVSGLLVRPEHVAAVETHLQANAEKKAAELALKAAKSALANVAGATSTHTVRWIDINPVDKAPYKRLDIRPKPKRAAAPEPVQEEESHG